MTSPTHAKTALSPQKSAQKPSSVQAIALIAARECRAMAISPVILLSVALYAILMGVLFFIGLTDFQNYSLQAQSLGGALDIVTLHEGVITPFYSNLFVLWLFLVPMITMRLIAEERKMLTFVLLMTAPIKPIAITLGKFLAGCAFLFVLILVALIYPAICMVFGNATLAPILSANLGLFLMGASFIALGLFASSLTDSPFLASALGFVFILLSWLLGAFSETGTPWTELAELSLVPHIEGFMKGVIDTYHLSFYVLFIAAILALTHAALKSERWR